VQLEGPDQLNKEMTSWEIEHATFRLIVYEVFKVIKA
jgi:hypothetical protein